MAAVALAVSLSEGDRLERSAALLVEDALLHASVPLRVRQIEADAKSKLRRSKRADELRRSLN